MLGSAVTGIVTIAGEHVKIAKKGEKVGLEISSKTGRAVQRGDELYLTTDTQLLDALQKTKLKTLPVSLKAKARKGERFAVEIRKEKEKRDAGGKGCKTEEPLCAEFEDEYVVQGAEKAPTTEEQIKKAMESLGDTPFEAASVEIEADEISLFRSAC
jgi:putative protease